MNFAVAVKTMVAAADGFPQFGFDAAVAEDFAADVVEFAVFEDIQSWTAAQDIGILAPPVPLLSF